MMNDNKGMDPKELIESLRDILLQHPHLINTPIMIQIGDHEPQELLSIGTLKLPTAASPDYILIGTFEDDPVNTDILDSTNYDLN